MTRIMPPHLSFATNPLSPKIMKLIFHDLAGDLKTLRACSLVCRSFRDQSRRYLFNSICIRDSPGYFNDNLHSRVRKLGEFIAGRPLLSSVIRELRLLGKMGEEDGAESSIPAHVLGFVIDELPNIRILELDHVNITPFESGNHCRPVSLRGGKRKLDVLTISSTHMEDRPPYGVLAVLGLFSTIGMLRIDSFETSWKAPSPADLKLFLEDLQVHRLSLKDHRVKTIMSYTTLYVTYVLLGSSSVNALQSVEINCSYMEQLHALGRLLRQTGDHLRSIAIDLTNIAKGTEGMSIRLRVSSTSFSPKRP